MAWRAFQSTLSNKIWGVESDDPTLVGEGEEIVIPPRLTETDAKLMAELAEFVPPDVLSRIVRARLSA